MVFTSSGTTLVLSSMRLPCPYLKYKHWLHTRKKSYLYQIYCHIALKRIFKQSDNVDVQEALRLSLTH